MIEDDCVGGGMVREKYRSFGAVSKWADSMKGSGRVAGICGSRSAGWHPTVAGLVAVGSQWRIR